MAMMHGLHAHFFFLGKQSAPWLPVQWGAMGFTRPFSCVPPGYSQVM